MVDEIIESSVRLERIQNIMEYLLAAVIPSIMAMMLFSYVLVRDLFEFFFALAVIMAIILIVPAVKIHRLHYIIWSKNTLPLRFITSLIGMVYISAVSVFAVSMISIYEGLSPERPLTFIIVGSLVILLIALMAYSAKKRDAFLAMEKKHFRKDPRAIEGKIMDLINQLDIHYRKYPGERRWKISLVDSGLVVRISPIGRDSTEVVVENIGEENVEIFRKIQSYLDGESMPCPSTRPSPSQSLSDERP